MNAEEIRYALSKQVPDIKAGTVIPTHYGPIQLNRSMAGLIRALLRAQLEQSLERLTREGEK